MFILALQKIVLQNEKKRVIIIEAMKCTCLVACFSFFWRCVAADATIAIWNRTVSLQPLKKRRKFFDNLLFVKKILSADGDSFL